VNDIVAPPVHSAETLAYAAGFFDGEGCVSISFSHPNVRNRRTTPIYTLVVKVSNTNKAILEWLQSAFEGSIVEHHSRKEKRVGTIWNTAWAWKANGNIATKFLELILPYLKIKQRSATLAIEFRRFAKSRSFRFSANQTQEVLDRLECYRQQINSTTSSKDPWLYDISLGTKGHTTVDLCYAAGLFDAEGTIGISVTQPSDRNKLYNASYHLRVKVANTDRLIIKWLHDLFRGGIHDCMSEPSRAGQSPAWEWKLDTKAARQFLEMIAPHLRVKSDQAILAIEFQAYADAHHRYGPFRGTKEVQEKKEDYRQRISNLKLPRKTARDTDRRLIL
jgi:hypothetical protein